MSGSIRTATFVRRLRRRGWNRYAGKLLRRSRSLKALSISTVFQALRIHCINERNWFWTALLLVLGFIPTLSILVSQAVMAYLVYANAFCGQLDMIVTRSIALPPPLAGCLGSKLTTSLNGDLWTRKVLNHFGAIRVSVFTNARYK